MTDFEQQLRSWWTKLTAWLRGGQHGEGAQKAKAAVQDKAQVTHDLTAYREWAPRVARFSFAASHVLSGSTAPRRPPVRPA